MKHALRHRQAAPAIALGLSSVLLIGAWIFEHGFGYAPCLMCYWQRHMHKAIIVLAAMTLLATSAAPAARKPLLMLTVLALLGSAGIAFFHTGVEFGFWEGPKACAAGGDIDFEFDPNNPLGGLDKKIKPPSCDKAVWHFAGLSMAAWNGILSLLGAAIVARLGFKRLAAND